MYSTSPLWIWPNPFTPTAAVNNLLGASVESELTGTVRGYWRHKKGCHCSILCLSVDCKARVHPASGPEGCSHEVQIFSGKILMSL
jgi:hypothetical protein